MSVIAIFRQLQCSDCEEHAAISELAVRFRITNSGRDTLRVVALKANGAAWNVSQDIAPGNTGLVNASGQKSDDEFEIDLDEQGLTLWTWSECEAITIERDQ
jgi:hypothetical protein